MNATTTIHGWPDMVYLLREREALWKQARLSHRSHVDETTAHNAGQAPNHPPPASVSLPNHDPRH